VIGLNIGPASDDADVEPVEVGGKLLVDPFLQLKQVLSGPQVVEGRQASVLCLDETILDDFFVVLSNLDGAQVSCPPVVARHVTVIIQKFFQIVIERVGRSVGVNLHNSNKLLSKSPRS
jgi:hypothetical protein